MYHADIWPQSSLPISPSGAGLIKLVHDPSHQFLSFPRLAEIIVKIRDVVRRFIAVGILADQPRQVSLFAAGELLVGRKKLVELCREPFTPAVQLYQVLDIVRDEERILPRIALGKAEGHLVRGERLNETAILLRTEKAGLWSKRFSK